MAGVFESSSSGVPATQRRQGLALAALCVGGMVLARTFDDTEFANEIREATRQLALEVGVGH